MFHLFTGSDRTATKDALTRFIEEYLPREAVLTTIDGNEYESGRLSDALGANSLFGGVQWFVIDTPSANDGLKNEVSESLGELAESENVFLILEGQMLAPERKKYEKRAERVTVVEAKKQARFDMFTVTEALASRDRRRLWILVQEARLEGARDEEIIGLLWWQLKTLRLAALAQRPEEVGMKSYPFEKAKRALMQFPNEQVIERSQSLLELIHQARAGQRDIDIAFEEWILS